MSGINQFVYIRIRITCLLESFSFNHSLPHIEREASIHSQSNKSILNFCVYWQLVIQLRFSYFSYSLGRIPSQNPVHKCNWNCFLYLVCWVYHAQCLIHFRLVFHAYWQVYRQLQTRFTYAVQVERKNVDVINSQINTFFRNYTINKLRSLWWTRGRMFPGWNNVFYCY